MSYKDETLLDKIRDNRYSLFVISVFFIAILSHSQGWFYDTEAMEKSTEIVRPLLYVVLPAFAAVGLGLWSKFLGKK